LNFEKSNLLIFV
jgi:T-complex protein 1 subunit beta